MMIDDYSTEKRSVGMYSILELKNFRSFKEISLELKPITLIAGKNNTGKSSILDSLFMFQDYADPLVFLKLLGFRGMRQADISARTVWEPLFNNMDTKEPIEIRLNHEYSLRLQRNSEYVISGNTLGLLDGKINMASNNYALSCNFERDNMCFSGDYFIGNDNLNNNIMLHSRDNVPIQPNDAFVQYMGPNTTLNDITVAEIFGQIELSQNKLNKEKLLDTLAILDEDIVDITTIVTNGHVQLYFTNRQNTKLPIHAIGDGLRKLLHLALILLAKPGSLLLLDEVENGLHYSMHAKLWETISTLAMQEGSQIVATTHSYECIGGALDGVTAAGFGDSFAYIRLDKNEKGIIPKTYSSEVLERALHTDSRRDYR